MTENELRRALEMLFHDILEPAIEEKIRNEVHNRVHAEAMRLLDEKATDIINNAIRRHLQSNVKIQVDVINKSSTYSFKEN